MFTKQRLLALLLVLNIIVSCLVICFSYGLYQNYNAYIRKGENQQIMSLRIYPQLGIAHKNEHGVMVSTVTKGGLTELLLSLSDEFTDDLECVGMIHGFMNDLFRYKKYEDKDYEDDSEIEYDDEGLYGASMTFTVKNGQILPFGRIADHISDEDYSKGRKCVVVGTELYDPKHHSSVGVVDRNATARLLSGNDKYITIEGERFDIIKADKQLDGYIYIPFTSIKDDTELWISPDRSIITLSFKQELTSTLYNELKEKAAVVLGDKAYIEELQFTEAEEIYYYRAVLLISVLIAILAAVNMAILYRYILERRSRELAIFRICGCGKLRAIMMYLAECMLINLPLFALTEFLWHRLLMKRFASLFEHFENAYSFKLYAVIFGIYAVSSGAVMLLMIMLTVRRHSLIEAKTQSKSSGLRIFKVFEAVQLTAVLALGVILSSAIMSRYELYGNFSDLLQGKGYLVNYEGGYLREDEFKAKFPGTKIITTNWAAYQTDIGGELSDQHFIAYPSDILERFTPLLSDGSWPDRSEHSYAKDKLIPTVVDPGSSYRVGDIITAPDIMTEWDENYQPTKTEDLKFVVVGKLKNMASVVSFPYMAGRPVDYRDIYGVYNSEFIDNDAMFIRSSDILEIYHIPPGIRGIQFIDCSNMADDEVKTVRKSLDSLGSHNVSYTAFEDADKASRKYIFEQLTTLFPIALCIFILTVISSISISAIYTKRHLHTYAVLYICGATWKSCALRSLRAGLITCVVSVLLTAAVLGIGKLTFMKDTVISFGLIPLAVCAGVLLLYLALSMIMPLLIIGKTEPREVLKEE